MVIDIKDWDYKAINDKIRKLKGDITLTGCCGQRFIAAGMSDKRIVVEGVPGDTMNKGLIAVHGNIGDAAGYSMRGGKLFVKGNAGYRAGIHMKAYGDTSPLIVIGGSAGSFLGEYQAGGVIVVLGLERANKNIVGDFPCTGMHGGKMFLRADCRELSLPDRVTARAAQIRDMTELNAYVAEYCELFGLDSEEILASPFTVITPDSKNPYKQMYVAN